MFWNFCLQPNILCPTIFPLIIPSASTIGEGSPFKPYDNSPPLQVNQPRNPLLNLSAKDLLKAGYQNKKRPWAEEEDEKLKELRDQNHMDWPQISKQIPGRNPKMCYNRYRRLQNHTKQLWKKAENDKLCELVEEFGQDWKHISRHFEKRTHKQVKEHYINYLRPEIKKDDWTLDQDLKLINFLNKYGKNWKLLEKNFEGRTQNQIKNRYFGRLKKLSEKKANGGCIESENGQSA